MGEKRTNAFCIKLKKTVETKNEASKVHVIDMRFGVVWVGFFACVVLFCLRFAFFLHFAFLFALCFFVCVLLFYLRFVFLFAFCIFVCVLYFFVCVVLFCVRFLFLFALCSFLFTFSLFFWWCVLFCLRFLFFVCVGPFGPPYHCPVSTCHASLCKEPDTTCP